MDVRLRRLHSTTRQDMWWLSGIHRDVIMYSKPADLHIIDYQVSTVLAPQPATGDGKRDARLLLSVGLDGLAEDASRYQVVASLAGPHILERETGSQHCSQRVSATTPRVFKHKSLAMARAPMTSEAQSQGRFSQRSDTSTSPPPATPFRVPFKFQAELAVDVQEAQLWSPERPWLYTLVISLRSEGKCADCEVARVGFRSVRVEGGQFLVNDVAVEVRGVNRHEHDERTGKYTDWKSMKLDIECMKQLNINAVRGCHYPNRNLWYNLCDAYGMYMW